MLSACANAAMSPIHQGHGYGRKPRNRQRKGMQAFRPLSLMTAASLDAKSCDTTYVSTVCRSEGRKEWKQRSLARRRRIVSTSCPTGLCRHCSQRTPRHSCCTLYARIGR